MELEGLSKQSWTYGEQKTPSALSGEPKGFFYWCDMKPKATKPKRKRKKKSLDHKEAAETADWSADKKVR